MTRKTSLIAAAVAVALGGSPFVATAQQAGTAANTLDTVIVTGTRVADRTVAESQSPIDIITPEALQSTGTTELATALARALPSLNFPRPAINDGTDTVRPAQLRGLSPDHVLVLVNGKRYHPGALVNVNGSQGRSSSPVDLNSIPISAIERVEVLRDGASAQYGSDAIAGVINVVLKGAEQGGSLTATVGQYSAGDGEQAQLAGDNTFDLGGRGFLNVAAQVGTQERTNRARPFAGTPGPTHPELGQKAFVIGDPDVDFGAISLNAEFDLGDSITAYAFSAISNGMLSPIGEPLAMLPPSVPALRTGRPAKRCQKRRSVGHCCASAA